MFYACLPDGRFLFFPHFLEAADGIRPGLLRVDVHLRIVDVRPSMTVAGAGKQRLQMWASMMRGLANAASISLPILSSSAETIVRYRKLSVPHQIVHPVDTPDGFAHPGHGDTAAISACAMAAMDERLHRAIEDLRQGVRIGNGLAAFPV